MCARASSCRPLGEHVVRGTQRTPRRRVRVRVRVRVRDRVRVRVRVRVSTRYAAHLGADAPEHGLDLGRGSRHLVHVREDDLLGDRRAGVRGRLRSKEGPS